MSKKFKFLIIGKKHIKTHEKFLTCFLGDTEEEAEKIYKAFSKTLNSISYNYAMSTGLEKLDLFEESLLGLARARRDFDPDRSHNFKTYAIYRIKDVLRTYIRENKSVVIVPTYLESARKHLDKIKNGCTKSAPFLEKTAKRAGISLETLIERVELIPSEIEYDDSVSVNTEETVNTTLLIQKLREHMRKDELQICDMIMEGRTYEEIGKMFGKSPSWVVYKLKKLRDRIGDKICP